jgi:hypothetical protein
MHPAGFEPLILGGERPQTYALDRAATGTGSGYIQCLKISHSHLRPCTIACVVYEQAARTQAQVHGLLLGLRFKNGIGAGV